MDFFGCDIPTEVLIAMLQFFYRVDFKFGNATNEEIRFSRGFLGVG